MSASSRRPTDVQFDTLARLVRDWADREVEAEVETSVGAPRWLGVERAMRRRAEWAGRRRALALTSLAAAAVVGLMALHGMVHRDPQLTFVIAAGTSEDGEGRGMPAGIGTAAARGVPSQTAGVLGPAPTSSRISFSDGSDVFLQPGARGLVVGTTAHGARVRLEEGRARFTVARRPQADWAVEAGPFLVAVHGTMFDVSWSPQEEALHVDLIDGAVTVRGPLPGGKVALQPGQRMVARASTGEARVEPLAGGATSTGGAVLESGTPGGSSQGASAEEPGVSGTGVEADATSSVGSSEHQPGDQTGDRATGAQLVDRHHPPSQRWAPAVARAAVSWPSRVAGGEFRSVVADAEALGIERCLDHAPIGSLSSLADAARYVRRTDLARRVLLAERRRFPGSVAAHDAAFLMGRLAEDASGDTREALDWYDRYLESVVGGTYGSEALARKMLALARLGEMADARSSATRYLETYPDGAFAARARRLLLDGE